MSENLLEQFSKVLRTYCKENNLNYEKIIESPKCGNDDILFVQHYEYNGDGLKDNEPAEIIIMVQKQPDGTFQIRPGDNIKKYLAL